MGRAMSAVKRLPAWTLVTGAGSGIGRAFAQECAARGFNLVLVDIDEDALGETARDIAQACPVAVKTFAQDLSLRDAADKCLAFCDENNIEIDFLINNAGIFFFDPLLDAPERKIETMCDLHVFGVTRMCILFGRRMRSRRFGHILNVSSLSAWMPMPGINVYNASKAYVRSLSNAVFFELKPYGVSVTALCPGGIDTNLFGLAADLRKLACRLGFLMKPRKLARIAVSAALRRKKQCVPGVLNSVMRAVIAAIPDFLILPICRRVALYQRFFLND